MVNNEASILSCYIQATVAKTIMAMMMVRCLLNKLCLTSHDQKHQQSELQAHCTKPAGGSCQLGLAGSPSPNLLLNCCVSTPHSAKHLSK